MKLGKSFLILAAAISLAATVLTASAQTSGIVEQTMALPIYCESLSRNGGVTTVTLIAEGLTPYVSVDSARLTIEGEAYDATAIKTETCGAGITIKAQFPTDHEYMSAILDLVIDGEQISFVLSEKQDTSYGARITRDSDGTYVSIDGAPEFKVDETLVTDCQAWILDGKQISMAEFDALPDERVQEITVYRSEMLDIMVISTFADGYVGCGN